MSSQNYVSLQLEDSSDGDYIHTTRPHRAWLVRHKLVAALVLLFLPSPAFNIISLLQMQCHEQQPDLGRSPFSGLGYNTPVVYRAQTDYWSDNETLSDELWNAIDTSPIGVALTDDYAKQHNLPLAGRFPWDDEKGTYFIKAFHQIHCLKLMRKMVVDLKDGNEPIITWEHYQHCLDALRQDIMCRADDTPMPGVIGSRLGDGQLLQCRDWNKLVAWTQAPEQNACYRSLDDYRTVAHSLERHAFCPEGSPYYNVSRAYFQKWGHVDPFVP